MRLPQDHIAEIVPPGEPSLQFVPPFARELAQGSESAVSRRAYLWAQALLTVGLQNLPPRCAHFSAGFVAVQPEVLEASGWSERAVQSFLFGGYMLVEAGNEEASQRVFSVEIDNIDMPMVITAGRFEPHGNPPHPNTGSGACWVKNKGTTRRWGHGILTCRHVVSNLRLGQSMSLHPSASYTIPRSGSLADIDQCTIDAAVVGVDPRDWPSGLAALPVHAPVSPKDSVRFTGRFSNASGSILRIFQYALYAGNLFGQRVIADCVGQPGDSGSLLVDAPTGEGVGLYMGTIPDGSGGRDGIYQDLAQAARYFQLDLYS